MKSINDSLAFQQADSNIQLIVNIIKTIQSGKDLTSDELLKELSFYANGIISEQDSYINELKNRLQEEFDSCYVNLTGSAVSLKNRGGYPRICEGYNLLVFIINDINGKQLSSYEIRKHLYRVADKMILLMVQFLNKDKKVNEVQKEKMMEQINFVFENLKDGFKKTEEIELNSLFCNMMLKNYNCLAGLALKVEEEKIEKQEVIDNLVEIAKQLLLLEKTRIDSILSFGDSLINEERKVLLKQTYNIEEKSIYFKTYNKMFNNFLCLISVIKKVSNNEVIDNVDLLSALSLLVNGEFEAQKGIVKDLLNGEECDEIIEEIEKRYFDFGNIFVSGYGK